MENKDRREFIRIAGTTLLVTSSISVFGLVSSVAKDKNEDDTFYSDGYYDDGYYNDGYNTGLNQIRSDSIKLVITPNPSNGNFELTLNTKTVEGVSIHIHDLSGKAFLRKSYTLQLGTNRISFESNDLPSGVYELSLITAKGLACSERLVIVK